MEFVEARLWRWIDVDTSELPVQAWHEVIGEPDPSTALCTTPIGLALDGTSIRDPKTAKKETIVPDTEASPATTLTNPAKGAKK